MEWENVFRACVKPHLWCDDTYRKDLDFEDESCQCDPVGRIYHFKCDGARS